MIKLKSCPFCGGEAEVFWTKGFYETRCRNYETCNCHLLKFQNTVEKAIEVWNKRVEDEAL